MQPEGPSVAPLEPFRLGERAKAALRQQHAAGKDVALNEIDILGIGREDRVIDRDVLQRRAPAGLERARDRGEIGRPIFLPDRFDHFDRSDRIVFAGNVAIVDPRHRHVAQAGRRDPLLNRQLLLGRQRDRIDAEPAPRRGFRKRPPATPDLEHAVPWRHRQPVEDRVDLGRLRGL